MPLIKLKPWLSQTWHFFSYETDIAIYVPNIIHFFVCSVDEIIKCLTHPVASWSKKKETKDYIIVLNMN